LAFHLKLVNDPSDYNYSWAKYYEKGKKHLVLSKIWEMHYKNVYVENVAFGSRGLETEERVVVTDKNQGEAPYHVSSTGFGTPGDLYASAPTVALGTRYEYDPNGNMIGLKRFNSTAALHDQFGYTYPKNDQNITNANMLTELGIISNAKGSLNDAGTTNAFKYDPKGRLIADATPLSSSALPQ
jgi:YD repeat-containing protein